VPFEALDEPACLGGGEGFVERGGLVGGSRRWKGGGM
jgi:hypothetical protein